MDAPRFDALTRRLTLNLNRRSLGLLASLGLPGLVAPTAAKKKRKKKKCKKCGPCRSCKKGKCKPKADGVACGACTECQGGACVAKTDGTPCPDGACQDGACQTGPCPGEQLCDGECIPTEQCCSRDDCPAADGYLCCNGECTDEKAEPGIPCQSAIQCCSNYCRNGDFLPYDTCAATCRGKACTEESKCCRGFSCEAGHCGGCGDAGTACDGDADCCFSACVAPSGQSQKRCQSFPGGPCEKSADCWACAYDLDCTAFSVASCQDGVCGCPEDFECCSNFDCAQDETCVFEYEFLDVPRGVCKTILPG